MRTAVSIHGHNIAAVLQTYDALSRQLYTHASPVFFHAGTRTPSYASCFIFQPDTSTPLAILSGMADIDKLWMVEGGVGVSLASIPASRCADLPSVIMICSD